LEGETADQSEKWIVGSNRWRNAGAKSKVQFLEWGVILESKKRHGDVVKNSFNGFQ